MAKSSKVKSQSSLEYLLIVVLTFAVIIPAAYLFFSYSKESTEEIKDSQTLKIGRDIVDTAESIFYSGQGSKTVLEINIPDNVVNVVIIDGRELVFNISTSFGVSEIVFISNVNMTTAGSNCNLNVCSIPNLAAQGFQKVKVEAINQNSVSITTI